MKTGNLCPACCDSWLVFKQENYWDSLEARLSWRQLQGQEANWVHVVCWLAFSTRASRPLSVLTLVQMASFLTPEGREEADNLQSKSCP